MPKLNPHMSVIKTLGFLHIIFGVFAVLRITLQLRNEPASGSVVSTIIVGYGFFGLPLIIGGIGLITFKNVARIFLIFYYLLIFAALSAPIIQICLQGPAYYRYWVDVFWKAIIPCSIVIYLLLPSVKRYFH